MYALRLLNGLLMVAIPIGLAAYINSKFKPNWRLWWIGGAAFILSQIGHIPFNYYSSILLNKTNLIYWPPIYQTIFNALFLGLSAGLWEETARYLAFRCWVGKTKSWTIGIQLGIGHGGFESIISGLLVLYTFIQMVAIRNIDISTLVPNEQLAKTIESIAAYWSTPWYDTMLGFIERVLTIPIQIALSVIMVQVFIRGKWRWFLSAILFHTFVNATVVMFLKYTNVYLTEISVVFFTLLSIWIIFVLKSPESVKDEQRENSQLVESFNDNMDNITEMDVSLENLDATKYQ